jgi:hypothetical protein
MAETPAPTLAGVERVVIACDADSSLTAAEAQTICTQLVKKAQTVTRLPVIAASPAAIPQLPGQSEQLVLHVALSADGAKSDRGTLAMTVTPSRNYLRLNQGAPVKSEAQLARLADKLVVQGPVAAFAQILGAAPSQLHRPIKDNI